MKVIWAPLALERVSRIADYIAQDNPSAARRWVIQVFRKVKPLSRFPERGRQVPETLRRDIRELQFPPYRIIYRIRGRQVGILTVRHGKQRFPYGEV
ncbi:MAG: plasmid stabilization protein [Elusimicrobia bacterium RIFCSPLOWO2_01_FULL_59_12]|nr:MAG: plasmid stabilization protein [Elusimicrobia bacterium RIFCSPLOWO2_01_FULL_59_12]